MERDDDILEEVNMLVTKRDCESWDDSSENIKNLSGAIELVFLVDKVIESVRKGFSDHFTTRDDLGVDLVKNGFEVLALIGLLRVKQF